MSALVFALVGYLSVLAVASGTAALARPRQPGVATLAFAVPAMASFPLFWSSPGPTAVIASMYGFQVLLRALDARASLGLTTGAEYGRYCRWARTRPSEDRPTPPGRARAVRVARA